MDGEKVGWHCGQQWSGLADVSVHSVTPQTKQAILRPLSAFRPAFRAIAQTLSDIDLVFVEEAFERLMLDYDRVFSGGSDTSTPQTSPHVSESAHTAAIHTPACLWRRTGEIYKANREFATLTGIPAAFLRAGKIGIYQLMTEESTVKYYEVRAGQNELNDGPSDQSAFRILQV